MRLIEARTLKLCEYFGMTAPRYAILSHTWDKDEVTFQDWDTPGFKNMKGFKKIKFLCDQAVKEGIWMVWCDTCCIDKTSSTELTEAINSMFNWYRDSAACYVYLEDVFEQIPVQFNAPSHIENDPTLHPNDYLQAIHQAENSIPTNDLEGGDGSEPQDDASRTTRLTLEHIKSSQFAKSRWFERGWTLQELLAPQPRKVHFYNSTWERLGTRMTLFRPLNAITGIDEDALVGAKALTDFCIARKMSWASQRKTTRTEDLAYCLLGIFDIQMPLLYGEGHRAFTRLQEEIIKSSNDQSIFAWYVAPTYPFVESTELLARHPMDFAMSGKVVTYNDPGKMAHSYALTNAGLAITLPLVRGPASYWIAALLCRNEDDFRGFVGIMLRAHDAPAYNIMSRYNNNVYSDGFRVVSPEDLGQDEPKPILILRRALLRNAVEQATYGFPRFWLKIGVIGSQERSVKMPALQWYLSEVYPESHWNKDTATLFIPYAKDAKGGARLRYAGKDGDIFVGFGYIRGDYGNIKREWVYVTEYGEGMRRWREDTEAEILGYTESSSHNLGTSSANTSIKWETVMGEEVLVVDVSFVSRESQLEYENNDTVTVVSSQGHTVPSRLRSRRGRPPTGRHANTFPSA